MKRESKSSEGGMTVGVVVGSCVVGASGYGAVSAPANLQMTVDYDESTGALDD
jgi:hypothetical protein